MNTGFRQYFIGIVLVLGGAFVAVAARADADPEEGRAVAYTCLGCHGIEGYRNAYPSYRVPKLGGQKAAYIEMALKEYRDGKRAHPTMHAQGSSLSDQDIEDVAAYFQGAEPAKDTATPDTLGDLDVAQNCMACHSAAGAAIMPPPPVLSGQQKEYIVHALGQYKTNARPGTVMSGFAGALSDEDIEKVAQFFSSRDGLKTPDRNK